MTVSKELIHECKERLLRLKMDLLNRARTSREEYSSQDSKGDEADLSNMVLAENQFIEAQTRLREHLKEIDFALSRIQMGTFGICEETDELIESDRLRAIPWTRLSIEGAEIQESMRKKFAR